jgi:hypothetical protein
VETSLDVQSSAAGFSLDQLRSHLRVDATLARFKQTTPSAQHQRLIGMDRADDDAIHALQELATGDAEQAHSDMMGPDKKFPFVRDIFMSLAEAQPVNIA